jgi:serine/threonine-protein kinase
VTFSGREFKICAPFDPLRSFGAMLATRMNAVAVDEVQAASRVPIRELGKYRLVAELARGGMGVVYLGLVRGPGGFHKLFVVKELKAHLAEDPELVSMFLEEARLAAKLNHPNVVQTIEVGTDRGHHFIAMEYLDGQSYARALARLRRAGVTLPMSGQLHILSRVLEGLQYAHCVPDFDGMKPRVVHRDVSPQNVFLTYDGQIKIIDFGIAKALEAPDDTRTGVLKGKLAYMAPEQAKGDPIDGRADVFSVGVMLWEAAVGHRMWTREQSDMRILHSLLRGEIPRPADARPDVDSDLERMILKATAAKPSDRYASAAEFQADVENHLRWLAEPTFGAREIQKLLSDAFAEERAAIKTVVDEQVRGAGAADEHGPPEAPLFTHVSTRSIPTITGGRPEPAALNAATPTYCTSLGKLASDNAVGDRRRRLRPPLATRILITGIVAVLAIAGGTWAARWHRAANGSGPAPTASAASVAATTSAATSAAAMAATVADPIGSVGSPTPSAEVLSSTSARDSRPVAAPPPAWRKRPPSMAPARPEPPAAAGTPAPVASPLAPPPETSPSPSPASPALLPEPGSAHVKQHIDTHDPYAN